MRCGVEKNGRFRGEGGRRREMKRKLLSFPPPPSPAHMKVSCE